MNKKELNKAFQELLEYEIKVRDLYRCYIKKITNKSIINKLKYIEKEEIKHMKLARQLIEKNKKQHKVLIYARRNKKTTAN